MYKLVKKSPDAYLSEIGQSLNVKFSFATIDKTKNEVLRLHDWVKCRDFLGDVLYANAAKKTTSIYGFIVNPELVKIAAKNTIMVVQFPDTISKQAFLANYEAILHPIEKANKLKKLTVVDDTDDKNVIVVVSDKFWQQAIWLISLYSYLLKSSCYKYKNVVQWRDEVVAKGVTETSYMKKVYPYWEKVIDQLHAVWFKDKEPTGLKVENKDISNVHNNCGFVAVIGNHAFSDKNNRYAERVKALVA